MMLYEMISRRKSTRSYTGEPVDETTIRQIEDFCAQCKPLYPDIRVRAEVVGKERVKCLLPWKTPQLVAIFSEDQPRAMENVGFLYQQLDLYLQSLGLGVCWLGMSRLDEKDAVDLEVDKDLRFVISLAFGHPKGDHLRDDAGQFKRKSLEEIADRRDPLLEPARLAPSSVNSQPWYFTHEGDVFHAYCVQQGLFKKKSIRPVNRIDMGIALAHMYVSNPDTFQFFKADRVRAIPGYGYIGSFRIG